ncbi:hypothetical protein [Corallococcus silvisoli]|uniref:hypothetical protein n=1 Tax=Corallococcus silvisoli TaxID=2697031 RepID=UPI0013764F0F|nr:hypothetical protein [Corallococcus silvisoli]NBD09254.1 hypothetical protein [Corallococcus silvisoli]
MSTPTAVPYTPPPEQRSNADALLVNASPDELHLAERAYTAYGSITGGRSAVTGAELPAFNVCNPVVRAGWVSAIRDVAGALVVHAVPNAAVK